MINEQGEIVLEDRSHAALYIDVNCYDCKREMALSNALQYDGRNYHERCLYRSHPELFDQPFWLDNIE